MARKERTKRKNSKMSIIARLSIITLVIIFFTLGILIGGRQRIAFQATQAAQKMSIEKIFPIKTVLPTANIHVPILVYHYVEFVKDQKDRTRKSLDIIPPVFEEQLRTLVNAGYNFITASELGQYLDGIRLLPKRPIVLTFDDGYEDFYTDVFPLLQKYHVKGTAYIISGAINKPNYMTLDQLKTVAKSGLVEIGAHTIHHPNLDSIPFNEAKVEIEESKKSLERELGITVVSFAYPYGKYNMQISDIVRDAGFTTAVTTKGGVIVNQENRLTLLRIHPGISVGSSLLEEISQ